MAKILIGTVSSDKPDKTVVVTVHSHKTHPIYKKKYTFTRKFMVHDEKNEAHQGDTISFVETRPQSAQKRHLLREIIERPAIKEEEKIDVIEEVAKKPASKKKEEPEE